MNGNACLIAVIGQREGYSNGLLKKLYSLTPSHMDEKPHGKKAKSDLLNCLSGSNAVFDLGLVLSCQTLFFST